MSALLTYLVAEEVAGRGDKLTGYKVGVEALRKPDHFDPGSDASVRVEAGRLRRMLSAYAAARPGAEWSLVIAKAVIGRGWSRAGPARRIQSARSPRRRRGRQSPYWRARHWTTTFRRPGLQWACGRSC